MVVVYNPLTDEIRLAEIDLWGSNVFTEVQIIREVGAVTFFRRLTSLSEKNWEYIGK